jgi:hypothetical protein
MSLVDQLDVVAVVVVVVVVVCCLLDFLALQPLVVVFSTAR